MTASISARRPARHVAFIRAAQACLTLAALVLTACSMTGLSNKDLEVKGPAIGLYELRVYTAADGKMDALQTLMREHEVQLFEKHGMRPIGFFTPAPIAGRPADNRLFYILGYKDRAARDAAWTEFAADPEWKTAYADSQKNGSLTSAIANTFLTATDYSPPLTFVSSGAPRYFELRTYHANPGRLEDLHKRFREHTLTIFKKHGMQSILYWRPVDGQQGMEDRMTYLLAFPNAEARTKDWNDFNTDPEWKKVSDDSQKTGPMLTAQQGVVSVQLVPTDYSPLR